MANRRGANKREAWRARAEPLKDDIEQLYVNGDLTQVECAEMFNITQGMFSRWLQMLGLHSKGKGDGKHRGDMQVWVERRCTQCRTSRSLRIHYRDGNPSNNALSNLEVVCSGCHVGLHKEEVGE